jgi:hypothetical protein
MCPSHGLTGRAKPKPFPPAGKSTIDPWVTASRTVAHPDAPAGGGGFGSFRSPAPLGTDGDLYDPVPHPLAPAARFVDLDLLRDKAVELQQALQKPPPLVTREKKKTIHGVKVTIEPDEYMSPEVKADRAETTAQFEASAPGAEFDRGRVTKIEGDPEITLTILTRYGSSVDPSDTSTYGRGTTCEDKNNGDTSLGFHESCHRQDATDFLKDQQNHPLPQFKGKVGMTEAEYRKAQKDFEDAVTKVYQKESDDYSVQKTDEVGCPKQSDDRKKKCKCP